MTQEIKDKSGKVLFTAEQSGSKLNINDEKGKKFCCVEHTGSKLQVKDSNDKVLSEKNSSF
jgi:hypothetical protein